MRRPLHIARVSADDPSEVEVLRTNESAYSSLEIASELWRLADKPDRAQAIDDVVTSAYELDPPQLDAPRIGKLKELLGDLEPSLVGTLTDDKHRLTRDQVDALRDKAKTLDFNESYGADARDAIRDALVHVQILRDILDEARDQRASILFD